jgi:hypothetical protein
VTRLADHFGVSVAYLVGEDIESPDEGGQLQRMFRLDPNELAILDDMMKSLLTRRSRVSL